MLLICLVIFLLVVGIVLLFLDYNFLDTFFLDKLGSVLMLIGLIFSLILGTVAIVVQSRENLDYENAMYQKEVIEYRIEHKDENITGNERLYDDIVSFNNNLRSTKKWANNIWTSWLFNDKIADIDYIEFVS